MTATDLHPADQASAERIARAIGRGGTCDHGLPPGTCRTCLELRHAEQRSVVVRAAYATGDWPPARSERPIRGLELGGLSRRIAAGSAR